MHEFKTGVKKKDRQRTPAFRYAEERYPELPLTVEELRYSAETKLAEPSEGDPITLALQPATSGIKVQSCSQPAAEVGATQTQKHT